ncbi:MAG TPA: hypothetical protein VK031_05345 [Tissierellaceae bacterium]|nr:hypothetical protein [Tissierellaceae bacterium]
MTERNFATNFYDTANDIISLCIRDAIWQMNDYSQEEVTIEREEVDDTGGILYYEDEPLLVFDTDFKNTNWMIYVKEKYHRRSKDSNE